MVGNFPGEVEWCEHDEPYVIQGLVMTSDASGSWGCGAFNSLLKAEWFQLQWPDSWSSIHITAKEMVPIIIAAAIWGRKWQGKAILCRCDNAAVVAVINSGRSIDALVMHLMHCLFYFQAVFSLRFYFNKGFKISTVLIAYI